MNNRNYRPTDRFLIGFDHALSLLFGHPSTTQTPSPAKEIDDTELTEHERDEVGRILRISHTYGLCSHAFNQAQTITVRDTEAYDDIEASSLKEIDQLIWCEERIAELDSRKSLLNPLFYTGSFAVGLATSLSGNRIGEHINAQVESQFAQDLKSVSSKLPDKDQKSRAVLTEAVSKETAYPTNDHEDSRSPLGFLIKTASKMISKSVYYF